MKKIIRIISPILLLAVMITIFSLSAQKASDSEKLSKGFTYKAFCILYPEFKDMTEDEQQKIISDFPFPVRKLAHFSLYFILGFFAFLSIATYDKFSPFIKGIISFCFSILYATSDEMHQYYVPGRSCELRDVAIDSTGALLAILLLLLVLKLYNRKKRV